MPWRFFCAQRARVDSLGAACTKNTHDRAPDLWGTDLAVFIRNGPKVTKWAQNYAKSTICDPSVIDRMLARTGDFRVELRKSVTGYLRRCAG